MNRRRVVVTGLGTVNPIGNSVQEFWNNALAGVSGADFITAFDTTDFKTKFACEVKGFDAENFIDRKAVKRMDKFTHYAVASASMAIEDAGLTAENVDHERVGVIIGSGIGGMWTNWDQQNLFFEEKSPRRISPFFVPMLISDIAAGHVSIQHGFKGPNYATTSACATSAHAIGDALMLIERGDADVMITGGAESAICPMGVAGFNAARALSTFNENPSVASRPFDKERDGFVMGDGGAIIVLEELGHAVRRGAKIYAELSGMGFTADAYHITEPAPGGEGAVRSMRAALRNAGLQPEDVQVINAHGTSTLYNDRNETAAIKTVFGEYAPKLKINSTKSMTGHLLGAAGAVEAIVSSLMIHTGKVHPTINYRTPDPECDLDYVPTTAIDHTVDVVLSNSFGFGGHNVTLLFRKYTDA
ncbi:MAG: beta-ketoacyl-ACP synthase II [Bacteroidota bacterium]|jgi:3-oxoacyl-[acyl-carrier-protein] synthase II|nr:beta-ketoacyl-ACP synthase II [Bacteroidota bacterium]